MWFPGPERCSAPSGGEGEGAPRDALPHTPTLHGTPAGAAQNAMGDAQELRALPMMIHTLYFTNIYYSVEAVIQETSYVHATMAKSGIACVAYILVRSSNGQ